VQVSPGGTVSLRDTVPEKWFSDVTVSVDWVDTSTFAAVGVVMVRVKSRNWNRTRVEWIRDPLVPVTVRV
jgi:hypothetical protein